MYRQIILTTKNVSKNAIFDTPCKVALFAQV